jgi:hypothetical protein
VHHSKVTRVLAQSGLPRTDPPQRRSKVDPYLSLILETLQKYPVLTASRLFAMVCVRGYKGSPDHFRHIIACLRPRPPAEAYLRRLQCKTDIFCAQDFQADDVEAKCASCSPRLLHHQHVPRIADINHDGNAAQTGKDLTQQLKSFVGKLAGLG